MNCLPQVASPSSAFSSSLVHQLFLYSSLTILAKTMLITITRALISKHNDRATLCTALLPLITRNAHYAYYTLLCTYITTGEQRAKTHEVTIHSVLENCATSSVTRHRIAISIANKFYIFIF